ncbi:MAG: hypothetical protein PHR53_02420 [Bacteroidales bacterium]|nr:hypothetical protein [Bacteroidales bacterium]
MDINLQINRAQLPGLLLIPKKHVAVEGRATGKSYDIGNTMDRCIRWMPKSVITLTGQTIGQLLTRTLPSALKTLNERGYEKGINYVIGQKPPAYFDKPYEEIAKFDNMITFSNGTTFAMITQAEKGSGRGANSDYEILDEALTINKEQYDLEVSPTNRGNLEYFGKPSGKPVAIHHGFKYSTSMPPTKKGRWILDYANYYETEKGINLFSVWNRVVKMQMELLDIKEPKQFTELYNEISRLKRQITPFVSKDDLLFTCSNAFDNLDHVGLSYIRNQRTKLPSLIFLIEIMNYMFDKVEDCFYAINEEKQIYYNALDEAGILQSAKKSDFDMELLSYQNSLYDKDCNPALPIEIVPDWGSSISLFCVVQERNFDFATGIATKQPVNNFINEFFVKPEGNSNILIKELCNNFSNYYRHHQNKRIIYYRDRYGDSRNPNIVNSKSFNAQAVDYLKKEGWKVEERVHQGMEPPQSDKYLLWGIILKEERTDYPLVRFNGTRCRYTLISMNNAMVKDVNGKLEKDKSSERKTSGVLPEEATHFSDAADKIIWTKYGNILKKSNKTFVEPRI